MNTLNLNHKGRSVNPCEDEFARQYPALDYLDDDFEHSEISEVIMEANEESSGDDLIDKN